MTREERKEELFSYIRASRPEPILELYMEKCLPFGVVPQAGTLASQMIEEILKVEFPEPEPQAE